MEKTVQIFKSFAEAEEADRKYYQSLTPAQRIQILLLLRSLYHPHNDGRLKRIYRIIKHSEPEATDFTDEYGSNPFLIRKICG
jgi:hypothetical protein